MKNNKILYSTLLVVIVIVLLRFFDVIDNIVVMSVVFASFMMDWIRLLKENKKLQKEIEKVKGN